MIELHNVCKSYNKGAVRAVDGLTGRASTAGAASGSLPYGADTGPIPARHPGTFSERRLCVFRLNTGLLSYKVKKCS